MSTTKGQRIGIIIIAIVMTVGTIGSFFIMILASKNSQIDQTTQDQQAYEQQQKQYEEYQKQQDELAAKLSPKYYSVFKKYESSPAPFDASKVKKLETKDLKKGTGDKVEDASDLYMYYIGWDASGDEFDSSFNGEKLKAPLDPSSGVIDGMGKGIVGMKIGGVREITMTADQAYGEQAPKGYPSGPLKFIVLAIPPQN